MRLLLAIIAMLTGIGSVLAQDQQHQVSGNAMQASCRMAAMDSPPTAPEAQFGIGYCMGVAEAIMTNGFALESEYRNCAPGGATLKQAVKVLVKFMDDRPNLLNNDLSMLAVTAYRLAWPCQ